MPTYITQPGVGAVTRTLDAKIAETRSAEDYGAAGTGLGDDGPALQNALDSLSDGGSPAVTGGAIKAIGRYRVATLVNLPEATSLVGDDLNPEQQTIGVSILDRFSLLRVATVTALALGRGAAVERMSIVQDKLASHQPPASNDDCTALLADYDGVPIAANRTGVTVRDAFLAGFNTCINANMEPPAGGVGIAGGRVNFINLHLDGKNGIYLKESKDIARIVDVHFWPFTTAHVPGVSAVNLQRSGTALYLKGTNEFTYIERFFSFGANIGMVFDGSNDVFASNCQIDYTNPNTNNVCGVDIINGSYGIHLINLHTEAQRVGVRINSANADEVVANIRGGRIVATDIGVDIQNGATVIDGTIFRSAAIKIKIGAISDNVTVINPVFDGEGVAIQIDAGFTGRCKIDLGLPCTGTPTFSIPDALIASGRVTIHDPFNYTGKAGTSAQTVRNAAKISVGGAALAAPIFGIIQASSASGAPNIGFWNGAGATGKRLGDLYFDGRYFVARRLSDDGLTVLGAVTLADTGV